MESAYWAKHAPLSMAPVCPVSLAGWEHVAICLVQLDIMERTVHRNVQSVLGKKDVVKRVGPVLTVILGRWDPGTFIHCIYSTYSKKTIKGSQPSGPNKMRTTMKSHVSDYYLY